MSFSVPSKMKPAPVSDRVAARIVDLVLMGGVCGVALLPVPLMTWFAAEHISWSTGEYRVNYREAGLFFAVAAVAALGYEPYSFATKYAKLGMPLSIGKTATGIELRCAKHPCRPASFKQAVGRYVLSVAACGAVAVLSPVSAYALGVQISFSLIVGLSAGSVGLVWLSALVSALFRTDRRGWHDIMAGTVLMSAGPHPMMPTFNDHPSQDQVGDVQDASTWISDSDRHGEIGFRADGVGNRF